MKNTISASSPAPVIATLVLTGCFERVCRATLIHRFERRYRWLQMSSLGLAAAAGAAAFAWAGTWLASSAASSSEAPMPWG